ncbi:MAG: hypothetical protein K0S44_2012 [Bacteroidetes bacterium]|jgi:PAS domain S-box-containing protein|nr:hypothetical protein [Bacteroidota bacterium]
MEPDLFSLDFTRWQILLHSIIPAFINFMILGYVSFKFMKTKTNLLFSLFVFLLGCWQLTEGFMRLSITENTANGWIRISELFTILLIPSSLFFVLRFTKCVNTITYKLVSFVFLIPAAVFCILVEGHFDSYTFVNSEYFFWITNPALTPFMIILSVWMSVGASILVILLWAHYIKNKKSTLKRRQSSLLLSGITIPILGVVLGELILPLLINYNVIPIAVPLMTTFSVTILIAMQKFKILDFSPRHHWEQIISNEGLVIVNNQNKITYSNAGFEYLTGYTSRELEGRDITSLIQNTSYFMINEMGGNRSSSQYETDLMTKDLETKSLLINSSPYQDSNDTIIGSLSVIKDITFLKKAEQELIENETRLKKAQQVAKVGSWELNLSDNQAIWSEEALKIYGLPPSEKFQSFETWLSLIHPMDLDSVKEHIEQRVTNLTKYSFKHRILCKDGTVKHIHSISEFDLDQNGVPFRLTGICHDITKEVTTEEALIESEKLMTTFMNDSLLCIYFVDPDTKTLSYSNSAFRELLNYSASETDTLQMYDFINYNKAEIDVIVDNIIANGKTSNTERQWKTKDGHIVYMMVSCYYVNRNGKKTIMIAGQDVSASKRTEQTLLTTNMELETFIYRASHDLRGPLASIIGLANISKFEIKDELALKYLDMIGTGTEKLDYTLTELVKAMEIKNINDFNNEIDFESMIKESIDKFKFFPGYSRVKIDLNVTLKNPFISNKFILETILQNLIENAIKYQNYSEPNPFINIQIKEQSGTVDIIVNDNGLGIEKSIQSRIFEMYYRGTSDLKGSGLGLYLVKKGAEKLGGEIHLDSIKGTGSTFKISLTSKNVSVINHAEEAECELAGS